MPQDLHDHPQVDPLGKQQAGTSVAEVTEADRGQSGPLTGAVDLLIHRAGVQVRPNGSSEHQAPEDAVLAPATPARRRGAPGAGGREPLAYPALWPCQAVGTGTARERDVPVRPEPTAVRAWARREPVSAGAFGTAGRPR